MKSIVDKLVSRIDAIEQGGSTSGGNQGESGEVKEHTHKVEQITDLDTSTFVKNSEKVTDITNESGEGIPTESAIVKYVKPLVFEHCMFQRMNASENLYLILMKYENGQFYNGHLTLNCWYNTTGCTYNFHISASYNNSQICVSVMDDFNEDVDNGITRCSFCNAYFDSRGNLGLNLTTDANGRCNIYLCTYNCSNPDYIQFKDSDVSPQSVVIQRYQLTTKA